MKYFSMFTGIGGFEYGIENAYKRRYTSASSINKREEQPEPHCVGYSEIDKYAISIYERHFDTHRNYGDCREIEVSKLPDFDFLFGGFPCQSFSIAGKRGGFGDTRGTLFFEIARIAKEKRPRLLLLENVKGLLSHDQGNTFGTILNTLDELGYDTQWQVLNSKNFGVPQNRERVYIVGHLRGTPRPEVFPITKSSGLYPKEITQEVSDAQRIYTTSCAKTLKGLGGGLGAKTGLYLIPATSYAIDSNYSKGINTGSKGGTSSLEKGKRQVIIKDKYGNGTWTVRRLTPIECERLQGFPDNWTQLEASGRLVSDTQRYKCLGNAVTTNVVTEIMMRIYSTER